MSRPFALIGGLTGEIMAASKGDGIDHLLRWRPKTPVGADRTGAR